MASGWGGKLIGAAVLLAASVIFGWNRIREEHRKIRDAEVLLELVEYIAEQIEYTMKPLPKILGTFEADALNGCGFLRISCEEGMWAGWERCKDKLSLPQGDLGRIFGDFCREIGKGYRKEELELCGLTMKRMKAEMDRSRNDIAGREKLYRTLPPLMMLSVILILL